MNERMDEEWMDEQQQEHIERAEVAGRAEEASEEEESSEEGRRWGSTCT